MKKFRFHQAREVFSAIFDLGLLYTVSGRSESAAQHHIKLTLKIMETNRIHPIDDVMIEIYEEGHRVGAIQRSGFNNVSEAVEAAYEGSRATHILSRTMCGRSPTSPPAPRRAIASMPEAICASSPRSMHEVGH